MRRGFYQKKMTGFPIYLFHLINPYSQIHLSLNIKNSTIDKAATSALTGPDRTSQLSINLPFLLTITTLLTPTLADLAIRFVILSFFISTPITSNPIRITTIVLI
jgi:hypothetical protein